MVSSEEENYCSKSQGINIYSLWSDELKTSSSSHPDLLAQRSIPLSLQEEHG